MGIDDKSGPPLWTPKVLIGGVEKPEAKNIHPASTRLLWHMSPKSEETDTEFEILTGQGELKFKVIGKYEDACAVIDAFRLREKIERNAMRNFLEAAKKKGADFSNDPTLSSYDEKESNKLRMFYSWLTMFGLSLITSGCRPWDGKVGGNDEGSSEAAAPFSIVKNDGGAGGDSTSN